MTRSQTSAWLGVLLLAVALSPPVTAAEGPLEFHDPSIVKVRDAYYVFSTGPGILVRRSADLESWEDLGAVFEGTPSWATAVVPDQRDLWAPDIAFFEGRYHLYYAISRFGSNRSAIGHASNKSLDPRRSDFKWVDHGMVIESHPNRTDWNAIDAHVAFDEKDEPWLFWGSFFSGIKAARLDPKSGRLAPDVQILPIAQRPPPGAVEAPYVVRKGDHYYLFLSFDFCCRGAASDYRLVVGRSEQIQGPYVDRRGRALLGGGGTPLVDGYGRWRGPGHNSVLLDPDGDCLVHHAYDADDHGKPRLRIRPLVWMPDGWPMAGEVDDRTRWHAEGDPPAPVGAWMHRVGTGVPARIVLYDGGAIDRLGSPNLWTQQGRRLYLAWPRADAPGGEWVDDCWLSPDGCRYIGRNQDGTIVRGWRLADEVGRPPSGQ